MNAQPLDSNDSDINQPSDASVVQDPTSIALMHEIDDCLSHIWMVRTFLKHSDEANDDEELADVHRDLYDFMLALGPALDTGDAVRYLKLARKKLGKLKSATESFRELQPEISGHMNFRMAAKSLTLAVAKVVRLLEERA